MNAKQLSNLWFEVWADLSNPGLMAQVGMLLLCLVGAWLLARALRSAFNTKNMDSGVVRWGMESFFYVLWPIFALLLITLGKIILGYWQNVPLLKMAVPLAASFAVIRLDFYILRRVFARNGKAGSLLLLFEKIFATVIWGVSALYITGLLPEVLGYMEEVVLPVGRSKLTLMTLFQGIISVALTLLLALWAGALLEERLMRLDTMHSSLRVVMARMGRAILVLVAILVSLSLVGIDLTVLSVFGGALGVGIGLGLQKIVSSYISGFVILIERSLAIGDMVKVDVYYGQVTQINTRYTVLQGLDGTESVIPNEMLVSSPIQNVSLTNHLLRLTTKIAVAYDTDIEVLLKQLEQVTAAVPRVLPTPEPAAILLGFGADGMDLEVGFWIEDPENGRLGVVSDVNRAIWRLFQEQKIKVPFPQREVRVLNAPEK